MKYRLLLALLLVAQPALAAPIRIVACEEKVPSKKRGVCANALSAADFKALAPGVSWFYNWHFQTKDLPPAGVKMTFLPMVWGDRPNEFAGLQSYLAAANPKPPVVLAINEPNLRGQAFISPEVTANVYKKVKAIADRYQIPTVGPHMSLGSPPNDSIKAMDPLTHKMETYGFMVPFLKAFFSYMGAVPVTATAYHSYGNFGELSWSVGMMAKEFKRPVWVTEYAQWNVPNVEAGRDYLIQATEFLERSPSVQGYAWFKERANDNPKISLFQRPPGQLSPLGEAYVALPPHDADLYYRIPGKLPAQNFVDTQGMEIKASQQPGHVLVLAVTSGAAWVDYNLQIDTAGEYKVRVRLLGTGKLEFLHGAAVLGAVESKGTSWNEAEAKVRFAAGAQRIRVRGTGLLKAIDTLEFLK